MWYFSWVLGLGLACAFGILNAMWFELREGTGHEPIANLDHAAERS
jgi:cyd operon protein YbgT